MARAFALIFFLSCCLGAQAQEQEGKLLQRLLKPNATLGNSAQDKQFTAGKTALSKRADVKAFYAGDRALAKSFTGQRSFRSRQFSWQENAAAPAAADLSTRSQIPPTRSPFTTRASNLTTKSPESNRAVHGGAYAGKREFLDRGKSQKSLSAKNTPLTIDQVRDLLNKSK